MALATTRPVGFLIFTINISKRERVTGNAIQLVAITRELVSLYITFVNLSLIPFPDKMKGKASKKENCQTFHFVSSVVLRMTQLLYSFPLLGAHILLVTSCTGEVNLATAFTFCYRAA